MADIGTVLPVGVLLFGSQLGGHVADFRKRLGSDGKDKVENIIQGSPAVEGFVVFLFVVNV